MKTMSKGILYITTSTYNFLLNNEARHSFNVSGCGDPFFKVDYFKTVSRWKLIALRGFLLIYLFKLRSPLKKLT